MFFGKVELLDVAAYVLYHALTLLSFALDVFNLGKELLYLGMGRGDVVSAG